MKRYSSFLLLAIAAFSVGCHKKCDLPQDTTTYLKGVVINPSVWACTDKSMIDFTEDSALFRQITGKDFEYCIAKGVDPALNIQGKKLLLAIKNLTEAEDFPCPTSNDFPHIGVTDTKPR